MRETEGRDNQQVTDSELGWLANAVESEGSIDLTLSAHGHQWIPRVTITNTDPVYIEAAVAIIEKLGVGAYVWTQIKHNPKHKPVKRIAIRGFKRNRVFLPKILPHMRSDKRRQVECLLSFLEWRAQQDYHSNVDSEGQKIREELTKMRTGSSETTRDAPA